MKKNASLDVVWRCLLELLGDVKCNPKYRYRVALVDELAPSAWTEYMLEPVDGYIEPMATGPILKTDVRQVEIDPVVRKKIGRLVPDHTWSELPIIEQALNDASVDYRVADGIVIIPIPTAVTGQESNESH